VDYQGAGSLLNISQLGWLQLRMKHRWRHGYGWASGNCGDEYRRFTFWARTNSGQRNWLTNFKWDEFFSNFQVQRWRFANILQAVFKGRTIGKILQPRLFANCDCDPRTNRRHLSIGTLIRSKNGISGFATLVGTYARQDDGDAETAQGNLVISLTFGCLLFLCAAILGYYGVWNLYYGPCDWKGLTCIWISVVLGGAFGAVFAYVA
jgi:hypothetical protein